MEDHQHTDDAAGQGGPEEDAEHRLREALARIDQVDDVQQRFLSEARRQVSELHVEATRARAEAMETARKLLADAEARAASLIADAEAEAASVLAAAREEAARLRETSEQDVKAHAEVLLAVAHKERDDLMAAASAAADRLREEGAIAGESLLNTAQAKAVRLVQEAKEEAARIPASSGGAGGGGPEPAPGGEEWLDRAARVAGADAVAQQAHLRRLQQEVRALADGLGDALDGLAEQIAVTAARALVADTVPAPRCAPETPPTEVPPTEAPQTEAPQTEAPDVPAAATSPAAPSFPLGEPRPLIGSRGNQGASPAQPFPVSPSGAAPEPQPHRRGAGPVGRSQWDHSAGWPRARRGPGWRRRGT